MPAIYFDDECRFCRATVRRCGRQLTRRGFTFVPLQAPGTARLLGVPNEHLLDEMRLRLDDGTVLGGAAAVVAIARRVGWAWPLWALSLIPGAMPVMRSAYRWIARNRGCINSTCELPHGER